MRIVFVGAGETAVRTAELLIDKGHEVIIIEEDADRIENLEDQLDCSFLNGDGSSPTVLKEADPENTDVLLSLSDSDQANLIASLVGRSLGFNRVITSIQDPAYEEICRELGLENTIIPSRTISRYLADMVRGMDIMELTTIIKDTARFFTFVATENEAVEVEELELPETAKVVCFYRKGRFNLARRDTSLRKDDEVIILTDDDTLPELKDRWDPQQSDGNEDEK